MPGLHCVLLPAADPKSGEMVRRLGRLTVTHEWEHTRTIDVIPGRLFIGSTARSRQVADTGRYLFRDGDLTCAVDGYIDRVLGWQEAARLAAAQQFAAAACAAYRAHGTRFPAHLEGQFAIVIHDARLNRLVVGNGRYGFAPLYMYRRGGTCLFCSMLGPLARSGFFEPSVDDEGVAEFLTYGQYFGSHTSLRHITVLDPASTLVVPLDGEPALRHHWDFSRIVSGLQRPDLRLQVDLVCDAFTDSASRIARRAERVVSGLSGGFDSRLVTALLSHHIPGLKAWTFGSRTSSDLQAARAVTSRLGIGHLVYELDPETIPSYAEEFVTTTNGAMRVDLAYGRQRRFDLHGHADLVLNGNAGDAILGGSMLGPRVAGLKAWVNYRMGRGPRVAHPWLEGNKDEMDAALYLESKYGHPSRLAELVLPRPSRLRDSVLAELGQNPPRLPVPRWIEQWIFRNRVRRWTILGILTDRPFYADDSPFYDHDVFDQCMAIPHVWRRGNRAYIRVLKRLVPEVADIPSGNTGLPASTPAWRITTRKLAGKVTGRARRAATGADFDGWARAELRDFYGDLLHSDSVLGRPFWDGPMVRSLFDAHQRGEVNCGHELALAAATELFLRRWVDAAGAQADAAPVSAERV